MVRWLIAAFGGAWLFGGVVLVTLAYGGVRHTDLCAPRAEFGDVAGLWPREAEEFNAAIAGRSAYLESVDHRDGNRIRSVRVERNTVTVALDGPNHWRTPGFAGTSRASASFASADKRERSGKGRHRSTFKSAAAQAQCWTREPLAMSIFTHGRPPPATPP